MFHLIVPAVKFTSLTVSVSEFNSNVALFSIVKSSSSGKTFEEPNVTVVLDPEILVLILSSELSINEPRVCEPVITISPCPLTFPVWLEISLTVKVLSLWIWIAPAPETVLTVLFSATYNFALAPVNVIFALETKALQTLNIIYHFLLHLLL